MILALAFVGCGASSEESNAVSSHEGKYSATFTDEIGGDEITYEISYTLNADGTGVYDGQDTVDFTWDSENND